MNPYLLNFMNPCWTYVLSQVGSVILGGAGFLIFIATIVEIHEWGFSSFWKGLAYILISITSMILSAYLWNLDFIHTAAMGPILR